MKRQRRNNSLAVIIFFLAFFNSEIIFSQNINLEKSYQPDYYSTLLDFVYDNVNAHYIISGTNSKISTGYLYLTKSGLRKICWKELKLFCHEIFEFMPVLLYVS